MGEEVVQHTEPAGLPDPAPPPGSPLDGLPWTRQPVTPVILLVSAWSLLMGLPATWTMMVSWDRPIEGLVAWMILTLIGAFPVGLAAGTLAARLERAAGGVRHPQRGLWVAFGLGAALAVHWALHVVWSPMLIVSGLGGGYRAGERLVGGLLALLAWAIVGAGIGLAAVAWRRLAARSWEGITAQAGPRRLPRLETPWVVALSYAPFGLTMGLLGAALAIEEDPALGTGVWFFCGLVLLGLPALGVTWLYGRLPYARGPHHPTRRMGEVFGALFSVHWGLVLLFALMPLWSAHHHVDRLAFAVVAAALLTGAVGLWGVSRARRHHGGTQAALP